MPVQAFLLLGDSTVFRNTAAIGGTGCIPSRGGGNLASLARVTVADNVGARASSAASRV